MTRRDPLIKILLRNFEVTFSFSANFFFHDLLRNCRNKLRQKKAPGVFKNYLADKSGAPNEKKVQNHLIIAC